MGEFHGNQHVQTTEYEYDDLRAAARAFAEEEGHAPTTEEAANDDRFPSIRTIYKIIDGSWNDLLEDAGLERGHVGEYGPDERVAMLQDLRTVLHSVDSDYLTTRQYAEHGKYGDETVKRTFGSWKEACRRANVDPGEKFGVTTEGPTGETLESLQELKVAQLLDSRGLEYEVHPEVEDTGWRCDFRVPSCDLWVEVNGFAAGERPNAGDFDRKLEYYEDRGMDYVVVESGEELEAELSGRTVES